MKRIIAAIALLAASTFASAGWVPIVDPDTGDTATNPQHVSPQDPGTIELWIEDLLGFDVTLSGQIDTYDGALLSNLDPGIIALHYGGGPSVLSTIAYICTVECATFDPPNTFNGKGISNERAFTSVFVNPQCAGGTCTPYNVPEPGAIALMGLGLLGLGVTRKLS